TSMSAASLSIQAGSCRSPGTCVIEDLLDLRPPHEGLLAAHRALPGRVRLFELPSLRGSELALVLDLCEVLRDHEPQRFGFGQIALLREAAQPSAKIRRHAEIARSYVVVMTTAQGMRPRNRHPMC